MAYVPNSGSVVAFQGNPSVLQTLTKISNSTSEPVPVQPPASGSLPVINVGSIITTSQGSVATVIIGGSVAASFTPPANQSVSGTVGSSVIGTVPVTQSGTRITSLVSTIPSSVLVGASIFGTVPVTQATTEWTVKSSLAGGIFPISGSVAVNFPTNQNISGSVAAFQQGTWSTSVMTNVITSIATAGQVMGSVAALQGTNPWTMRSSLAGGIFPISGSVAAFVTGGIQSVAFAGANTVSVVGTVAATQSGTHITSIVSIVPSSVLVGASIMGAVPTYLAQTGGSSVYAVLSSVTTISVMNANSARKGGTIYNAAGTTVFIKLGTAATTSVYTVALNDGDYYELPFGYTSVVAGISASNAGRINVTEII